MIEGKRLLPDLPVSCRWISLVFFDVVWAWFLISHVCELGRVAREECVGGQCLAGTAGRYEEVRNHGRLLSQPCNTASTDVFIPCYDVNAATFFQRHLPKPSIAYIGSSCA